MRNWFQDYPPGPKIARMPHLIAAAIVPYLATAGIVGALGFTGTAILALGIGYAATFAATYALSQLVAGQQKTPAAPSPSDVQTNIRQAISARRRVYDRFLCGSVIVFGFRRGEKSYILHYICEGPIGGYVSYRLDRKPVMLDASGFVTDAQYQAGGRSRVQILTTLGTMTDGPFPALLAAFPELDNAAKPYRHRGCAMVLQIVEQVPAEQLQTVYPNNMPSLQVVIDGLNTIYDPRTGTAGLSGNAGLCLLSEIMDVYGLSTSDTEDLDFDAFGAFADHCDDDIGLKAGGTEKRYRCAGVIQMNAENEERVKSIAAVCNADVYMDPQGRISVRQKLQAIPGIALRAKNGDHLSVQLEGGRGAQKQFNTVKVVYVDPALNWKENEVTWRNSGFIADDGAEHVEPLALRLCPSPNQAQRLGKLFLHENNPEYVGSLTTGPQGLDLLENYVFTLDLRPEDSIERVANAIGSVEYDAGAMTVSASCVIFAEGATDWTAATDEQDAIEIPPVLTSDVDDVTLTVTPEVGLLNNSAPVINFSWVAATGTLPDSYSQQVLVSAADEENWLDANVNQDQNTAQFGPVADGGIYDWRIRNITAGKTFDWQNSVSPVSVTVNTTPPGDITLAVAPDAGEATITITTPLSNPPASIKIYRQAGTGGTLDRVADLIATIDAGPGGTYPINDSPLAAGAYTWWAEPFNISGVPGTLEGPDEQTVT